MQVKGFNSSVAPLPGKVSVMEPSIARETRSLGVRATLSNLGSSIPIGSFVKVLATVGEEQTVIRLPSSAVRTDTFGNFVFILEKDGNQQYRAKRKPVTVLAKIGDMTVLRPQLSELEVVATMGAYKLREGILVKLDDELKETETSSPQIEP